ncbi:MAG: protein phosphatase CheZ [Gammaproteobacteria bacterium]|nr:protein phosphatase CheZ [Gammaproteobacteria bacterium]
MVEYELIDKKLLLEKTKILVSLLESENSTDKELNSILDDVIATRETSLFNELGKMTREIHESIQNFRMDSRIADLANTDIPDAKDRLEYVITMTENAANKVMTVVEHSSPVAEKLSEQSRQLTKQWQKFRRREMDANELRTMGNEVENFFAESDTMMMDLLSGFTEVMMAQDFQDLTGQIIRKVINLVNEIESNLVELIKIQGENYSREEKKQSDTETKLEGPQIPGKESSDVMKGQDEVDDLLASLGF